jgi:outer membrane biosynthesis protein TonB
MRVLALALVLLATPAQANALLGFRDWAHCRLYPSHERCRPAALPEPVQAPPAAPPPAPAAIPPPPVATPQAVPVPPKPVKAKPLAKPKPKYKAAPIRKRLTAGKVAAWCAQVPKGTSMGQIEFFAALRGVKLTPANRQQAQACLNSKGT